MTKPSFKSALALATDLRSRRIGCLELLDYFWERNQRFNPKLNAIVVDNLIAQERAQGQPTKQLRKAKSGAPCTVSRSPLRNRLI